MMIRDDCGPYWSGRLEKVAGRWARGLPLAHFLSLHWKASPGCLVMNGVANTVPV